MIRAVVVVVPAKDEEERIGCCLEALTRAREVLTRSWPGVRVRIVVAADSCQDHTEVIARQHGADVIAVEAGSVGGARRAGVLAATQGLRVAHEEVWVASTDADTEVPPGWLERQLAAARLGARLVLGRAVPDHREVGASTLARWWHRHTSTDPAAHIHGANLGFRLDDYEAVGGWLPLAEHEDRELVGRLLARGIAPVRGLDVVTSARLEGRVAGGFSGYLRRLEAVGMTSPVRGT